jgi:hypothetical protein
MNVYLFRQVLPKQCNAIRDGLPVVGVKRRGPNTLRETNQRHATNLKTVILHLELRHFLMPGTRMVHGFAFKKLF